MKPKTRITARTTGLRNDEHFAACCDNIATLAVQIRQAEAARDAALQRIRDDHEPQIGTLRDRRDAQLNLAEAYAFEHASELFPRGKSAESSLARYGLRIGQPTLKTLNRRWTWAKVLDALRTHHANLIRRKEEPDKDSIKAQLGADPAALAEIGLKIEQSESFWLEPKDQGEEAAS